MPDTLRVIPGLDEAENPGSTTADGMRGGDRRYGSS